MTTVSRERSERREDILRAANSLFARADFGSLTMDDVAREARMSKGGLYRHFESKDELLSALTCRLVDGYVELARAVVNENAESSGLAVLRSCIERGFRYAKAEPAAINLAIWSTDVGSSVTADCHRTIAQVCMLFIDLLERGQADGSVRRDVPIEHLGLNIWGTALGAFRVFRKSEEVSKRLPSLGEPSPSTIADLITSSLRAP